MSALQLPQHSSQHTFAAPPVVVGPGLVERLVVFVVIFFLAFAVPTTWISGNEEGGDTVTQLVFLLGFGFVIGRLLGIEHLLFRAIARVWALAGFVLVVLLSFVWSSSPGDTLPEVLILFLTTLFAVAVFIRFELDEIIFMIILACLIGTIANYVMVFGVPSSGQTVLGWSGVFGEKNSLGRMSAFAAMNLAIGYRLFPRIRFVCLLFAVLNVGLIVGTTSGTSMASGLGLGCCLIGFQLFRGRKTLYGAVALSVIGTTSLMIVVLFANLTYITRLLGKDTTLTGRTKFWSVLLPDIRDRPLLGHGYGGFFTDWFGPAHDAWLDFGGVLPHAHNAILQLLLEVGVVGTAFYLLFNAQVFVNASRFIRAQAGMLGLWPLQVVTFATIFSITEVGVAGRNIFWMSLVIAGLAVAGQDKISYEEFLIRRRELDRPNNGKEPLRV